MNACIRPVIKGFVLRRGKFATSVGDIVFERPVFVYGGISGDLLRFLAEAKRRREPAFVYFLSDEAGCLADAVRELKRFYECVVPVVPLRAFLRMRRRLRGILVSIMGLRSRWRPGGFRDLLYRFVLLARSGYDVSWLRDWLVRRTGGRFCTRTVRSMVRIALSGGPVEAVVGRLVGFLRWLSFYRDRVRYVCLMGVCISVASMGVSMAPRGRGFISGDGGMDDSRRENGSYG